jgi:hypothetical protein
MSLALSPRDARVLRLGGAAIVLLLVFARGLPAWRRWDVEARDDVRRQRGREVAVVAAIRGLPAALDSAEARRDRLGALAPSLLDGESAAAAGATLASILTGGAARAGVRLGAVQVQPDTASAGTFTRVAVHADATGDLEGITELLRYLEAAPELLVVRDLSITQPDAGGAPDRPESLQLELTLQGLALIGRRPPAREVDVPASPEAPRPGIARLPVSAGTEARP